MLDWPSQLIDLIQRGEQAIEDEALLEFLQAERENFEYDEVSRILYRMSGGRSLAFFPFQLRADLVARAHQGQGHVHANEVLRQLSSRCWWPTIKTDITQWLKSCPTCQVHGRNDLIPRLPAVVPANDLEPFQRWSIDFIGRLPTTENGNRWIITAIDHCTRWPIAKAIPEATEEAVGLFIYEEIVSRFGVPMEIMSDRGRSFSARILKEYMNLVDIKHLRTSAYHPRTNGKVENFNGTIGKMLSKAVKGARHKWDSFIDQALFACRVKKHRTTGFSPFQLVYGVEPKVPGDLSKPFVLNEANPEDRVEIMARRFEDIGQWRQAANTRSQIAASQAAVRYDRLVVEDPLEVGTWVLLRRERRLKFESQWLGPFRVESQTNYGVYRLSYPDGQLKEDLVHRDRLKRVVLNNNEPPTELWSSETLEEFDQWNLEPEEWGLPTGEV